MAVTIVSLRRPWVSPRLSSRRRGVYRRADQSPADRVVDVVVNVGDPVRAMDDAALRRIRLPAARMAHDTVAHLPGEVQGPQSGRSYAGSARLRRNPNGQTSSSARSPACPNGVCPRSCPSAIASVKSSFSRSARATVRAIPRHLQRMRQPRPIVVALRRNEYLCLVGQPPERLGVNDAVPVALEAGAVRAFTPIGRCRPLAEA